MTDLRLALPLIIFFGSLAGCGGSATTAPPPTAADLRLGTAGSATVAVGSAVITFPVFSQYSVTGVFPGSAFNTWDRVAPSSVRVQALSPTGTAVGSTFVTVSFAIKNGSQPLAGNFSNNSVAVFKNLSGTVIPSQIAPTFTIANVR